MVLRHLGRNAGVHTLDDIKAIELDIEKCEDVLARRIRRQVVHEQTFGLARIGGPENCVLRRFTTGLLVHESLEAAGVHRLLSRCTRKREHSCISHVKFKSMAVYQEREITNLKVSPVPR